jgi:CelD/BcsL family acetyltransferase involved in cellulose biosynthesis
VTSTALIDPTVDPAWATFVDACPGALIFHHPTWLRLLRDQYGYELTSVCIQDEGDEVIAGLPLARIRSTLTGKRLVALPFSDVCGPLTRAGAAGEPAAELAEAVQDEQRRLDTEVEIREEVTLPGASVGDGFYHHTLELQPDIQAVEAGFSKSQVKRGIKKALREGVVVERATDRAALDTFYRLHLRTRRHQGVPTQPRSFIRRFERLFDEDLGFVLTARWRERAIAAAIFLTFNGTLTYKYGASHRAYLSKRPNNLLFSEAICWGCANGMTVLDFGRTDLDNDGLRAFKRAWGADERLLLYTRLAQKPQAVRGEAAKAPLRFVIRHSPPLVGRLLGAVLYRHAG